MTTYVPTATDRDLFDGLLSSWLLSLEAERKSPSTLNNYRLGVVQFHGWLAETGRGTDDVATITPELVREWLAHLIKHRTDSTVRTRYVSLRQFSTWLMAEREVTADPMANVRQPRVAEKLAAVLSPAQVDELLAGCGGNDFADLRDRALFLLFGDTGLRRGAVAGMTLDSVDLRERLVLVQTKGDKHLLVPFGAVTAQALDRYLRARRREKYSDRKWFWLSSNSKGQLTANGILQMCRRRGSRIGLPKLHPHMFRHTFADSWLTAGGSESDLMAIAGWSSEQMVRRYGAARRAARARDAHRRLSPMDNR